MKTATTLARVRFAMVISVMLLGFMLQGCTTPFVQVDVKAGEGCESSDGRGTGVGLCDVDTATGQTVNGITCNSGVVCEDEGEDHCRGSKVCTTVLVTGYTDKCTCKCK